MKKFNIYNIIVHGIGLFYLSRIIYAWFYDPFAINPIEDITRLTGKAALIFLILTLSASPINFIFRFNKILKVRRILGLYSFTFALTHFIIFIAIDYVLDPLLIYDAVLKQPFALIGFIALLVMTPLAYTSSDYWKKKLRKKWKSLHKGIYLIAILVIIHYFWLSKDNLAPGFYSSILVGFLLLRIPRIKTLIKKKYKN